MTTPTPLPDFPVDSYDHMLPVHFEAPAVNPAIPGLYAATVWTEVGVGEPSRHLTGVEVRGPNYGGDAAGVWGAPWCGVPPIDGDERKEGTRPPIPDPFDPLVVWAYDECDLTEPSRVEVQARAAQVFRLEEQPLFERAFATRLLVDAADVPGGIATRPTLKEAVGYLEGAMAETNTVGFFHVAADLVAIEPDLFVKSGTARVSPSGHTWVIGGGYVAGLGGTLVATSQPFGWRDQVQVRTAIDERHNTFAAIAERSVVVGYEAVIAAVTVTPEVTP